MKTILVALAMMLAITQGNAQKISAKDVPANVKSSLEKNYAVKDVDWDKEGTNYEASFEQNGKDISLLFDASGAVLVTETEIKKDELPQSVLDTLTKDFAAYKIEETAKIETNGKISYEVEVEKGKQNFDLIFDVNGKLLEKLPKKEEEKD
jgi:uncharacterized protein with ATP-grasp and redox domains